MMPFVEQSAICPVSGEINASLHPDFLRVTLTDEHPKRFLAKPIPAVVEAPQEIIGSAARSWERNGRHAGHSHLLEATAPCMVGSFMILLLSWLGVRHLSKASRRTKVRVMIVLSWFR
jgi:hypothetical protein